MKEKIKSALHKNQLWSYRPGLIIVQLFIDNRQCMSLLSFLGLGGSKVKDALRKGAIVIDVRTPQEFDRGKVPESINIPVDRIAANAERIKGMSRQVVFCCSSGARSSTAASIMKQKGLKEVYNGGSWENVLRILKNL